MTLNKSIIKINFLSGALSASLSVWFYYSSWEPSKSFLLILFWQSIENHYIVLINIIFQVKAYGKMELLLLKEVRNHLFCYYLSLSTFYKYKEILNFSNSPFLGQLCSRFCFSQGNFFNFWHFHHVESLNWLYVFLIESDELQKRKIYFWYLPYYFGFIIAN